MQGGGNRINGRAWHGTGWFAQGPEIVERQDLAALEMTQFLAAQSVEIPVQELQPMDVAVGTARRTHSLALGLGGRTDNAAADGLRRRPRRGRGEHQEGIRQMAKVALQGGIEDLERLGNLPGPHVVAGTFQRAGELVGTGRQQVQAEFAEGEGTEFPHVVAGFVTQRFAQDEASAG